MILQCGYLKNEVHYTTPSYGTSPVLYLVLQILASLSNECSVHNAGVRTAPPRKRDLNAARQTIALPPVLYTASDTTRQWWKLRAAYTPLPFISVSLLPVPPEPLALSPMQEPGFRAVPHHPSARLQEAEPGPTSADHHPLAPRLTGQPVVRQMRFCPDHHFISLSTSGWQPGFTLAQVPCDSVPCSFDSAAHKE